MSNEDILAKVRHKVAGDRLLIVADNFDAEHPLDTVVKTTSGKTAYGFIPDEVASNLGTKPAPVIVTEELFDHLDVKGTRIQTVAQRGFNDMRDAVEYALQKPETVASGGGDGSFNIFFKKEGFEKGLMYANLMYSNDPTPAYIVRSISPTGKVKGDLLFEGNSAPSMSIPSEFDDKAFEEKIKSSAGDRVSGKTWNKGNVMKALRMHAQEGKYPTAEEFAEINQWIADGKTAHLTSGSVGMYIKQALEQKNSAMFFKAGQEADVWNKVAPEIEYITSERFLKTMERADNASIDIKSAIILASMAIAAPEDKRVEEVKICSNAFNLGGKDLAIALIQSEKGLLEFNSNDAEKAYKTVESIVGNKFENTQMLDDVLKVCKLKHPDFEIGKIGKYCHLVADAVKTTRVGIDIKSMSPEEKKAYFTNKTAYDVAAVKSAFASEIAKDNSIQR
ncbi:MAG: hypothetical protein IKO06_00905 [Alphaproteobacteria bacterium]|nr:hypothetical protein [Alphaproteobacteria bacterium]